MQKHLKIMVNSYLIPGWVVAGILSWTVNHSFWWCIFHMMCSWLYVVYAVCQNTRIPMWLLEKVVF